MPILVIPKSYRNSKILREQDLDNIRDALLTFFNTTRLDETNLQLTGIIASFTAAQVGTIINKVDSATLNNFLNKASQSTAEAFYAKSEIYDSNSNFTNANTTLTTSFGTRLTYTFPASGIYLVTYGVSITTPNRFCTVKLFNNTVGLNPDLAVDTFVEQSAGSSSNSASFALPVVGVAGQDLTLGTKGSTSLSSTTSTDFFMSIVRLS